MTEKVYKRKLSPEAIERMRQGGKKGTTGGFFKNRELARSAGKKGGLAKARNAKGLET